MSRVYSLKKLLAFSLLFSVLGVASAASVSIFVNQAAESSDQNPPLPATLLLINVTLDKTVYHPGGSLNVTLRNDFDQTVTFSDSVFNMVFEKWNGTAWNYYKDPIALAVMTYLKAGEIVHFSFTLDQSDLGAFTTGRYRITSEGGYSQGGSSHVIWGYAEFLVE